MRDASQQPPDRLFPPHLLHAQWRTFHAAGYTQPVTGIVYRGAPRPTCGMPLGGLDTGCIDLEANGMFGYSTIFNHLVEPRALLNLPMLGLACHNDEGTDSAWVLIADTQGKTDTPQPSQSAVTFPPTDYAPHFYEIGLAGAAIADSIDYWGHYPIVDMEFNSEAPVTVGVRAWSPFIPGDTVVSMTPGAVFEIQVRNPDSVPHSGTVAFNFPGFGPQNPAPAANGVQRRSLAGPLNGVLVQSQPLARGRMSENTASATGRQGDGWEMAYVLAVLEDGAAVRHGGALNADKQAWSRIADQLPPQSSEDSGASLAFPIRPGPRRKPHRARCPGLACPPLARGRKPRPRGERSLHAHVRAPLPRCPVHSQLFSRQPREIAATRHCLAGGALQRAGTARLAGRRPDSTICI